MSEKKNLDAVINELGYKIVENIDKHKGKERNSLIAHIDKALGVLVNDGVYAYYVFCKSKDRFGNKNKYEDKLYSKIFITDIANKLRAYINFENEKTQDINQEDEEDTEQVFFQNLSEDLHELLFFREMLETVLIYARYHAKTLGDRNE
ncbi:MAG: hypothetical protein GX892_15530 [Thermoanaerobacteraceae bacterium]|nr:hypothetical protein [Thermoanaerobacteraceae bacterium]